MKEGLMYRLIVFVIAGVLALTFALCLKWSTETTNPRSKKLRFWIGISAGITDLWIVCVAYYLETHAGLILIVAALVTATAVWAFRKTCGSPRAETTTPTKG
jgi:hypothetical protein